MDLIDYYPCISATSTPCTSEDTLELVVANRYETRQPESVIVHVPDPEGRFSKNGSLVWSTVNLMNFRHTQTRLTSGWSIKDSGTVTAPGGGDAPGRWLLTDPDDSANTLDLLDAMDSSTVTNEFFDLSDIGTDPTQYVLNIKVDFWALGTYNALLGIFGRVSGTTYTDSGTYIFHVGPVAELEVRDGDSGLAPAGTRAFTIVAVNNGPDDAPAAQVTVSGLNVGDYVSHSATAGAFDSTSGVWTIGELRETGYLQDVYGHDGEVLTIITSAAVDTEITAAITNTQDYQVCIDSSHDDVDLSSPSETACTTEDSTNTWHTAKYYDYVDGNDSATIKAKDGTGADLPSVKAPVEDTASIIVEWDAIDEVNGRPVTHYEIEWSADGTTNWQQLADDVTNPRYVDTDVEAGDTRYYRIRAVNDWDHKGPWSPPMKGTVPVPETASAGAPEAPVLTASLPDGADGRTQIDLAWDKPVENGSPITSYTLEVSDSRNGPWAEPDPTPQLVASDTSWSHTGLTGGARKYYRMKATNSQGDSDWSAVIEATTRAPGKAGPPLNLRATPDGDTAIDLSWDPPVDDGGSPIRYYEVQWSADGTSGWRGAGRTTDAETRTFKNTGMSFGTTRYYRVAARNGVTLGDWSDPPASATTLAGVPGQPNLTARATDANTIALTWTVPADNGSAIIRYELEHSPDGAVGSWISLTSPGAADTSYSDTGLDPGTLRYYRIRAVNGATPGEGSWSTVRSATTPPAVPGAPTLRAEANGQNAIDVIWEPPFDDGGADITSYELHWSADGAENSYARLTSPSASARSYTHSGLQPGDTRYYRILARNRAGSGGFSEPASATTLTGVPAAPSLTARANGATEIKLTWNKPDDRGSDILLYHLQQSDDGNDWHYLDSNVSASDTEYVHTGLSGGTTKYYRIRAGNGNGDGQWSATRTARTDAGGPDAPVLTLTVVGDNQIDLSWTEPANNGSAIRGYWVERSADGDEPWERLTSNNRTRTYSDDDLYRGMTRHYRVAAFNSAGTGPYSDAKSATTTGTPATAPGAPTLLRFSNVSRYQVTIAWEPPEDNGGAPVSGYEYEVARPCEDNPDTPENESEFNCGFTGQDITSTTAISARVSGINTDGSYDFRVRAVNPVGKGEWSGTIYAILRPSTSAQVRVSPTTITVNEGATVTYNISLSTAPPHPVQVFVQPQANGGYSDLENAAHQYTGKLLVPTGWTHPDPDEASTWQDFTYNWNSGVRVTFTAPEDSDTDDEVSVLDHFVIPLPYDHYRPCRQETQAERDQCKQEWEDAWAASPYRQLTGASVKIIVRDND